MSSQLLPINQIDAMPVQTISGLVNGTTYTVGGRIARYFSPAALQLDHVFLSSYAFGGGAPNHVWFAATPYLNLTGCQLVSFLVVKTYGTYLGAGTALNIFSQTRLGELDAPDPFFIQVAGGYGVVDQVAGKYNTFPTATPFVAAAGAGEVQRAMMSWGGTIQANVGSLMALGTNTRFVLSSVTKRDTDIWGDPAGILTSATLTVAMWAA